MNPFARIALMILCVTTFVTQLAKATPPFDGTIFLDPDIITESDPTTYQKLTDADRGERNMYDRRSGWVYLNAFLFNASFSDGADVEIQVNPEFGDADMARAEALKYAPVIGRLPKCLRKDVETVWIHMGNNPFGGGNDNLLIHTGQAEQYSADGILEETLVHEAAHTSLDAAHANASEWLAAQDADGEFISTYARDNPYREDVAESFLPYYRIPLSFRPNYAVPCQHHFQNHPQPNRLFRQAGVRRRGNFATLVESRRGSWFRVEEFRLVRVLLRDRRRLDLSCGLGLAPQGKLENGFHLALLPQPWLDVDEKWSLPLSLRRRHFGMALLQEDRWQGNALRLRHGLLDIPLVKANAAIQRSAFHAIARGHPAPRPRLDCHALTGLAMTAFGQDIAKP